MRERALWDELKRACFVVSVEYQKYDGRLGSVTRAVGFRWTAEAQTFCGRSFKCNAGTRRRALASLLAVVRVDMREPIAQAAR